MKPIAHRRYHLEAPPSVCVEEALRADEKTAVVDVRSPSEFDAGSFPFSLNIPLLDDDQRAWVGRIYNFAGRDRAVEKGYALIEATSRSFLDSFRSLSCERIFVTCARGGFRSRSTAAFLREMGLNASQIEGGFKKFRNFTLDYFSRISFPAGLVVLYGKTGCGKTSLLNRLPNSVDLEACASHRGSLFGGVGLGSVPQKTFESRLLTALMNVDPSLPVIVEGESRKIGKAIVPARLFGLMKSTSLKINIESDIEKRVERTLQEYLAPEKENPERWSDEMKKALENLKKLCGKRRCEKWREMLERKEYGALARELQEEHYDPKYEHRSKNYRFAACFRNDREEECLVALETWLGKPNDPAITGKVIGRKGPSGKIPA